MEIVSNNSLPKRLKILNNNQNRQPSQKDMWTGMWITLWIGKKRREIYERKKTCI